MSKAWMPLYVGDYLADTSHLTTIEHGAYMLLIMHYWQKGSLPTDDLQLARIARLTESDWSCVRIAVAPLFQRNWKHKRIDAELEKSEIKAKKASQSAASRWNKTGKPSNANGMRTHSDRNANGMLSQSQSHIEKELSEESSKKSQRSRRTQIAEDQQPNESQRRHASESVGMTSAVFRSEWQRFRDHHRAKGTLMADWNAAWRTWCSNWLRFNGKIPPTPPDGSGEERRIPFPGGVNWPEKSVRDQIRKFEVDPRTWPESVLGSPPGKPGCYVPADLLPEKYRPGQRDLLTERQSERVQ